MAELSNFNKEQKVKIDPLSQTQENSPLNKLHNENKAKEKKEAAEESMRTRCKVCFKETSPRRLCNGHGGGSGGGSESTQDQSEETSETKTEEQALTSNKSKSIESIISEEPGAARDLIEDSMQFDLERMLELFSFHNDSGRGILSIKAKPGYSSDDEKEMQSYLQAIKSAFELFKIALEKKGIKVNDFTAILDKNNLIIRIPSPKYYDAFIQELVAKNLLPDTNAKQYSEKQNPTPFATTPAPWLNSKEDLEEEKRSGLSPFSTELRPKSLID